MASIEVDKNDNATKKPSKIPRYVKSKIPVCSTAYKKIVREVKEKRLAIEIKEAEVKLLKHDFEKLRIRPDPGPEPSEGSEFEAELQSSRIKEKEDDAAQAPARLLATSSSIRSVIVTPKGTKRKVNPTHFKFRMDLSKTLETIIKVEEDSELKADDLFVRLEEVLPGVKRMERAMVLRTVATIFRKKIKHRGKKREGYYSGLTFVKQGSSTSTDGQAKEVHVVSISPQCKIRKGGEEHTAAPTCKGRLTFLGRNRETVIPSSGGDALTDMEIDDHDILLDLSTNMDHLAVSDPGMTIDHSEQHIHVGNAATSPLRKDLCVMYALVEKLSGDIELNKEEREQMKESIKKLEQSLTKYEHHAQLLMSKQEEVIKLYKEIVESGRLLGGLLSLAERNAIVAEVKKANGLFNLGIRSNDVKDLVEVFDPLLFHKLLEKLKMECPTISNILEQLVLSANASRNTIKTPAMKMKAAVHLLASLLDVRDQRSGNDIPVLFGLLCMCYGAGPSMIELLQHLGLSESFPVLSSILRQQLVNYKEIILKRMEKCSPVITYQDNMQLARTSMRHLRLSKLHKDKAKQGKMWDFTVRGWREANIDGMEHLFEESETASKQQRELKDIQYEETKIESNPEHNAKWKKFKERNMLRKLDLCLNGIQMSSQEILSSSSEELQHEALAAEKRKPLFKLDIPPPDEEHPDLSKKASRIFPLPISHENQCKIVGVANNLELFSDEFCFHRKKEKKFLPLKSTGKEFDLESAYKRYAFMKELERHKEEQQQYEHILRGEDDDLCLGAVDAFENADEGAYQLLVLDGFESDDDLDQDM